MSVFAVDPVLFQLTSTGCPVGTEPAERFMLQSGVVMIFELLFHSTNDVVYAGIVIGQFVEALILSTYAKHCAPPGQDWVMSDHDGFS